jgi:hypothetical protein
MSNKTAYEVRDIDQSAEIDALKGELAQCRELSELRLQSEQKLIAERDRLFEENGKLAAVYAERDDLLSANKLLHGTIDSYEKDHAALRAALEQILRGPWELDEARHIARRALELEEK